MDRDQELFDTYLHLDDENSQSGPTDENTPSTKPMEHPIDATAKTNPTLLVTPPQLEDEDFQSQFAGENTPSTKQMENEAQVMGLAASLHAEESYQSQLANKNAPSTKRIESKAPAKTSVQSEDEHSRGQLTEKNASSSRPEDNTNSVTSSELFSDATQSPPQLPNQVQADFRPLEEPHAADSPVQERPRSTPPEDSKPLKDSHAADLPAHERSYLTADDSSSAEDSSTATDDTGPPGQLLDPPRGDSKSIQSSSTVELPIRHRPHTRSTTRRSLQGSTSAHSVATPLSLDDASPMAAEQNNNGSKRDREESTEPSAAKRRKQVEWQLPSFDYNAFLAKMGAHYGDFENNGNIIFPHLFNWLSKDGSGGTDDPLFQNISRLEYFASTKGFGIVDDGSEVATAEEMLYMISQQLIRQYPPYYMLFVALRPDHSRRLVAYPHCKQDALLQHVPLLGDCRHGMDPDALEELSPTCTLLTGSSVYHGEAPTHFASLRRKHPPPPLLLEHPGDVRISWHLVPHGPLTPCPVCHKTPVPTYVAVAADHQSLEYSDIGTWADVAAAHRTLTPAPRSGYPFKPADDSRPPDAEFWVPVRGISALSDALVGRRRFDQHAVVREMRDWFCEERFEEMRRRWLERAGEVVREAWTDVSRVGRRGDRERRRALRGA